MKGRFAVNGVSGGVVPIPDIRFYANPSIFQYTVDRNGDSAIDGAGTAGSLRYCLTNCTANDVIIFANTLTDSALSGCPNLVELTSVLPAKVATIYGNGKYITMSTLAAYRLSESACMWYSMYFVDFFNVAGSSNSVFNASDISFYGCLFQRIYLNSNGFFIGANTKFYFCQFKEVSTVATLSSGSGGVVENCLFDRVTAPTNLFTNSIISECVFASCSRITSTASNILKSTIIRCTSVYSSGANSTFENNIVIDTPFDTSGGVGSSRTQITRHNTFIIHNAVAQVIYRTIGLGFTYTHNFQNNLIIAPACTFIFTQAAPAGTYNITESGNTYIAVNADPLINTTTSQRVTTAPSTLISLCNRLSDNQYGIIRPYYMPKGVALNYCARLVSPTDDFLGKTRGAITDCGAIDTEGT